MPWERETVLSPNLHEEWADMTARARFESNHQQYRRRPDSAYDALDESNDALNRILQLMLLIAATFAMLFILAALSACEFLSFYAPNLEIKESNLTNPYLTPSQGETTKISIGIFKILNPANPNQWFSYKDVPEGAPITFPEDLPLQHKIARWGTGISATLSCLALFCLLIEICCCRFVCSRIIVNLSFLVAMCCTPTGFLLYTHGLCNIFSSSSFACELSEGARDALIAMALLLVSLILSCVTPKFKPFIRMIKEREGQAEYDPCCFCKGRSKEEILLENPELLFPNLPSGHVEVPIALSTFRFKHYFDDQTGGVTLQSQYNAASQRWLQCERDYEHALDRFKQECRDFAQSDTIPTHGDWRYLIELPQHQLSDPEVVRQKEVLEIVKNNCKEARRVMERIEADLEEHLLPTDQKIQVALRHFHQQKGTRNPESWKSKTTNTKAEAFALQSYPRKNEETARQRSSTEYPAEAVLAASSGNDFGESPIKTDKNEASSESSSVEEALFKSAVMAVDETDIEDELPDKRSGYSWMSWMGLENTGGDKYNKVAWTPNLQEAVLFSTC